MRSTVNTLQQLSLPTGRETNPLSDVDAENSAMQLQFVASKFSFDPEGFEHERPLRRRPYYSHPYLTCIHCNFLYFLDISTIRYVEAQIEQKIRDGEIETISSKPVLLPPNDALKPCERCKRVDCFVAGAIDATEVIKVEDQRQDDQEELERISAAKILWAYRRHLQRMYTRAIFIARTARKQLKSKAATMIASIARGRLARRRYVTEQHLVNIRESHALLVRHALKIVPGKPKVFWYRRPIELKLVFANYVDLVERTGFQPPRIIVERNIAELSRRITARKNELIIMVQKRWRGFVARRIVRYFRTEIHRIFSHMVANSMRIQAAYRGHAVRRKVTQWRTIQYHQQLMRDYQHQRKVADIGDRRALAAEKAKIGYQQERKDAQVGRFMDKVAFASEIPSSTVGSMKSMNAYQLNKTGVLHALDDSAFGDDRYMFRDAQVISEDQQLVKDEASRVQADIDRLAFIKRRIAEPGPLGYGFRSGISTNTRVQSAIAKVLSMKKECSRSKAMRLYFQREFEAINNRSFERVSKNQRAIALAPGPLPDMNTLDPYNATITAQLRDKEKALAIAMPGKKISTYSERLRTEFRLYNLSRLGDEAVINRPGSQKTKQAPPSLLETVKVPPKKRDSMISSREGSRSALSSPPSSSSMATRPLASSASINHLDETGDSMAKAPSSRGRPRGEVTFSSFLKDTAVIVDDGDDGDAGSDAGDDGVSPMTSPHEKTKLGGGFASSSKLRVRRFRTGDEADAKKKETVQRAKQRAERAAMVASRPKYKGYTFPNNINFNAVGWLYEEDDDAIFG